MSITSGLLKLGVVACILLAFASLLIPKPGVPAPHIDIQLPEAAVPAANNPAIHIPSQQELAEVASIGFTNNLRPIPTSEEGWNATYAGAQGMLNNAEVLAPDWDPNVALGGLALPPFEPNSVWAQHASQSRATPQLVVMLAYEVLQTSETDIYYGPVNHRLLVVTENPQIGVIAGVFEAGELVATASGLMPKNFGMPLTVIYNMRNGCTAVGKGCANVEQLRRSTCASWQLVRAVGYDPTYEPITMGGTGKCLELGNIINH